MKATNPILTSILVLFATSGIFARQKNLISNSDNEKFEKIIKSDLKTKHSLFLESKTLRQNETDTLEHEKGVIAEEGFIEKMDNYLITRLSFTNDIERFEIGLDPNPYEIFPNAESIVRLNLNYKFISLGINFLPKFLSGNDDNITKGETKSFGLDFDLNFDQWFQQLAYSKTKGYYLNNTEDFDPSWSNGDPYIQFPNLQYQNFQGITGYSFNPKFSTKALLTGTERQLKSAGSFMPMVLYRYYIVDNRDKIVGTRSTQKSANFEAILSAGYYYTYVLNGNFYISGGGSAGYGFIASKITTRSIDDQLITNQTNGIFRYDLRGALGYNSERFFGGVFISAENSRFEQLNTTVINSNLRLFSQFFIGYRFHSPKKLRKIVESIPIGEIQP